MSMIQELRYTPQIEKVCGLRFSILSPAKIEAMSVVKIESHDTYVGDEPKPKGLFDPRMGVLDQDRLCPTDLQNNRYCPGYFGHIELSKPVFNGIYLKHIVRLLQVICFRCAKVRIDYDELVKCGCKFKKVILKAADVQVCARCDAKCPIQIQLQKDSHSHSEIGFIEVIWRKEKDGGTAPATAAVGPAIELIDAETVKSIFCRISDAEVKLMGFDPKFVRPEWLIISMFPVPPPAVRPSVHSDNNTRMEDDLTHKLSDIFKIDALLRKQSEALKAIATSLATPEERELMAATDGNPLPSMWVRAAATPQGVAKIEAIRNWYQLQYFHAATLANNSMPKMLISQQRNGRSLRSMKDRLEGKEGRVRWNLMGKRVDFSARSVITPDPLLGIDEVGVPHKICKTLTVPETVTLLNIERLNALCRNGAHVYPGANSVLEKSTGRIRNLKLKHGYLYLNKKTGLQLGDIVNRHLLAGDIVFFNRQPSLHRMSMMAHVVRPRPGYTLCFSESDTTPYNADFDGDEMNMHVPQSYATRVELELAAVETQIISPGNHKPIIAAVQDGLVGGKLFTSGFVFFTRTQISRLLSRLEGARIVSPPLYPRGSIITTSDKKIAYQLIRLGYTQLKQAAAAPAAEYAFLAKEDMYSAYQIFDTILPRTLWYHKEDVVIENGCLLKGTLRDTIVGKSNHSLVHIIFAEYGPQEAKRFINNYNWLMNEWMQCSGMSVGIKDLMLPRTMHNSIREHISTTLAHLEAERENLCIVSRSTTMQAKCATEFRALETQSLTSMSNFIEQMIKKHESELLETNRLHEMVKSGSKGKMINITQMSAALGSQHVDGKKIEYGTSERVLPHHHKFDDKARSHGYIPKSLMQGLDFSDCYFHAMCGREGLIDTAVKTAHTGYIQRKLVKALEDAAIEVDHTVRDVNSGYIVSFAYGSDGMDAARVEYIFLPIFKDSSAAGGAGGSRNVYLSDADITTRYVSPLEDTQWRREYYPSWTDDQAWHDQVILPTRRHVATLNLFRQRCIDYRSTHHQSADDIVFISPVHFERLISNVVHQFTSSQQGTATEQLVDPTYVIATIDAALYSYGALSHTIHAKDLPTHYTLFGIEPGQSLTSLMHVCFISYLSVVCVGKRRITRAIFDAICKNIDDTYFAAVAPAGELAGTISAQSMGEPATQMTLRTFHFAGVANRASMNQGVSRLQELLNFSKRIKTPCNAVFLKKECDVPIEDVMNSLVRKRVGDLATFSTVNTLNKIQRNRFASTYKAICPNVQNVLFYPWEILICLDEMKLIDSSVSVLDVWSAIDRYFQSEDDNIWIHIDYATPEQASRLHVCIISSVEIVQDPAAAADTGATAPAAAAVNRALSPAREQEQIIKVFKAIESTILNDIVVKGLPAITECCISTRDQIYTRSPDGVYTQTPERMIEAHGQGLMDIMIHPQVDYTRTISNDIYEIYTTLGIEAARIALLKEIQWVFTESSVYVGLRHIELLVDMMTCRGTIMSFDRHGINRSSKGPLSKCSFEETPETIFNAAIYSEFDGIKSVSSNIMFGQLVPIGTGSIHLMIDESDPDIAFFFTGIRLPAQATSSAPLLPREEDQDGVMQLFD